MSNPRDEQPSHRLKRAYDLVGRPAVLRGEKGDRELFKIVLAELQDLRRRVAELETSR